MHAGQLGEKLFSGHIRGRRLRGGRRSRGITGPNRDKSEKNPQSNNPVSDHG
jgi:hypothetical protein